MARSTKCLVIAAGFFLVIGLARPSAEAQQVTSSVPLHGVHDRFYEHFNIGWGFERRWRNGGMFFNFGGPMHALPPFGGYNPAGDAHFGWGWQGNNGRGWFSLAAGTGSSRTMTMSAPSLTTMNGVPGFVADTTIRPFVVGLIPVVGDYPVMAPYGPVYPAREPWRMIYPLQEKIDRLRNEPSSRTRSSAEEREATSPDVDGTAAPSTSSAVSSAERGDVSVAEIRRQQAEEAAKKQRELERLVDEAKEAEGNGNLAIARVRYRQAAAKSSGDRKKELLDAAARLQGTPKK